MLPEDIFGEYPESVRERFYIYLNLLKKWQARINLVSGKTLEDAAQRHFRDSAQLAAYIPADTRILFDLGSGAGFPGMVLAMLCPDIDVHLIESDQKKSAFLQAVVRETGVRAHIHTDRIESVSRETMVVPDVVTARALASLPDLFSYCAVWAEAHSALRMVFPKGAQVSVEIDAAREDWVFQESLYASQTDPSGQILVVDGLQRRFS